MATYAATTLPLSARDESKGENIDQSFQTVILIVLAFFVTITVVTTALRLYTRIAVLKQRGWEDWFMCFATLGLAAMCGTGAGSLPIGLLNRTREIPRKDLLKLGNVITAVVFIYTPAIASTKLSILFQMMRIFIPIHSTKSYYAMQAFIWFNMLYYLADFIFLFVSCFPRSKTMSQEIPGMCIMDFRNVIFTGVCNTLTDFALLVMPMVWITRLQMSTGRKVVACAVFTVGILACGASATRLGFSIKHMLGRTGESMDEKIILALCMASEIAAGIVCGNLPSLPAFVRHIRGRGRKSESMEDRGLRNRDVSNLRSSPDKIPDMVYLEEARCEISSNISGPKVI